MAQQTLTQFSAIFQTAQVALDIALAARYAALAAQLLAQAADFPAAFYRQMAASYHAWFYPNEMS